MSKPVAQPMPPRTLNLLAGLFRAYMGLDADQVVVYNQKWRIPSDGRIYVVVGYLAQKPFGANTVFETFGQTKENPQGDGLEEVTTVNSQETFSINLYSRSELAVTRKDEVIACLASTAAQQLCEANSIKLGKIPVNMTDLSQLDGTAILNRFVVTINSLCARSQRRVVEYFDKFPTPDPLVVINP